MIHNPLRRIPRIAILHTSAQRKLIFKGTFEYNSKQKEIIIHIEGDENSSLKIKILTLTSTTLSLEDEGGNKMDLVKTIKRDCSGTKY